MNQNWPTKDKDMHAARVIMEEYAQEKQNDGLGLFEIVVDKEEKRMNFQLSGWVVLLAKHFVSLSGATQGDFVTRQVISKCITRDAVLH